MSEQTPLLKGVEWDEKVASEVAISMESKGVQDPCYFTYASNILKLHTGNSNQSSSVVHDRINPDDIIGVEIEFDFDKSSDSADAAKEKAIKGREKMEALERDIGRQMMGARGGQNPLSAETLSSGVSDGAVAYLVIYAYERAPPRRGIIRQLKDCIVQEEEESDAQVDPRTLGFRRENHRRYKLRPLEDLGQASALVRNIRSIANLKETKRYLVVVNPFSGTKDGKKTYEEVVKKMFQESRIEHDVLVTKYAGHAEERMMKDYAGQDEGSGALSDIVKDVSSYDGIIVMGGDGILAEVLKGLHTRDDFDEIRERVVFGIVGCGTCNGLAMSITHAAKERYSTIESTFLICKGRSSKLDLSHYETENKTYSAFLTYSWAFIADVDIESECIRFIGQLRMDLWAVWRMISLRTYKGKLSFLPAEKINSGNDIEENFPAFNDDVPSNWVTMEEDFILLWVSQVTHASTNTYQSPDSKLEDGIFNIMIIRQPCSRLELTKIFLGVESGTHFNSKKAELISCAAFRLDPISSGSFNNIDGEVVEPGRIQARVVPSAINFFT